MSVSSSIIESTPHEMCSTRCQLCGAVSEELWAKSYDAEYKTSPDRYSLYRCDQCDVLFISPIPKDKLSLIYPQNYYSFALNEKSFVFKIKRFFDKYWFQKILARIPDKKINILDVGGGTGEELDLIRSIDSRVVLTQVVDLDAEAIRKAEEKRHQGFLGPIEQFETEKRFHVILLLNLIEHVADPRAVLIKSRDLLASGGLILVKTPNFRSLDGKIFRHLDWGGFHCPRHWCLFNRASFEKLLTEVGLHEEHFAYTQGAAFWGQSILFWLDKRGIVSITRERPAMFHPLFPLLSGLFAGFDFLRASVGAKTSQMFFLIKRNN